jgi:hypothetical protein
MTSLSGSTMVPMKKLLLWLEMARQELQSNDPSTSSSSKIPLAAWTKVLRDLSS